MGITHWYHSRHPLCRPQRSELSRPAPPISRSPRKHRREPRAYLGNAIAIFAHKLVRYRLEFFTRQVGTRKKKMNQRLEAQAAEGWLIKMEMNDGKRVGSGIRVQQSIG